MSLYIFGDSLTRGHYGIGYVKFLDPSFTYTGWDGATLQQIISFSAHHLKKIEDEKISVVFQGGANDALYTYLSTHKNGWSEYANNTQRGKHLQLPHWKEEITKKIEKLKNRYPEIHFYFTTIAIEAAFARKELYEITLEYNRVIESITRELSVGIIDLFSSYKEVLGDKEVNPYMPENSESLEKDASYIGGRKEKADELSTSRGLILTTDGIHPNTHGAKRIAKTLQSTPFL